MIGTTFLLGPFYQPQMLDSFLVASLGSFDTKPEMKKDKLEKIALKVD